MGERSADQVFYSLQDHQPQCYDEASEDELDFSEIEDEVADEQDIDEDSDFDNNKRQHAEQDAEFIVEEPEQDDLPQARRVGRSRSVLRGRNNFRWSANVGETQERHSMMVYLPSAEAEAKNIRTPLEAWSLFFTDEMLERIVQHTNKEIERKRDRYSEQLYYRNTDLVELKAFLGLLYFGGVEKNHHRITGELWSPEFGSNLHRCTMTEHRFIFLCSCIRFDDKNTRAVRIEEHALAPIKELWDSFINNCKNYYSPSTHCTIDEQLLSFRDRFRARVYISSKPDRYGIKIVCCNDAQTSYLINAEPYVGRLTTAGSVPTYYIKKLSETIHNSERTITCDNWFMSVNAVVEMKQQYSLKMIGTIRKNKSEIPRLFTVPASASTIRYAYTNDLTLLSYAPKRNKIVLLLSSIHRQGRVDEETGKPEMIAFYNKTKGGTDTFDQMCKTYTVCRISSRWTMRLFYGMLDQAGINANILYNLRIDNDTLSRREFLKELALSLIKPHLLNRLEMPTLQQNIKRLIRDVLSIPTPQPESVDGKLQKRKRCAVCPARLDKKTSYCCTICKKPVCEDHRLQYCNDCAP